MTKREISQVADAVIEKLQKLGVIREKPVEKLLDINEAAEFINLSASTIYKNKNIPRVKRGGKLYFTESSLSAYVTEG